MTISRQSNESLLTSYEEAMLWLVSVGVRVDTGRVQRYGAVLKAWVCCQSRDDFNAVRALFPKTASTINEVPAFIDLYQKFKHVPADQLSGIVKKLSRGVNGPEDSTDETPESSAARNHLFEAVIASKIHRPDQLMLAMLDAEADTGFSFDRRKVWVECKRVSSNAKLEKNTRKACNQLGAILRRKSGINNRGLIAIDISKLVNPSDDLYVTRNEAELEESTAVLMDKFIQDHSTVWQKVFPEKNQSILGALFRLSMIATSEQDNLLVHTTQWAVNPRNGLGTGDTVFLSSPT
ncbi:MAG: hypothetical protein ACOH2K_11790 [Burkholderiaceae bacterium]